MPKPTNGKHPEQRRITFHSYNLPTTMCTLIFRNLGCIQNYKLLKEWIISISSTIYYSFTVIIYIIPICVRWFSWLWLWRLYSSEIDAMYLGTHLPSYTTSHPVGTVIYFCYCHSHCLHFKWSTFVLHKFMSVYKYFWSNCFPNML